MSSDNEKIKKRLKEVSHRLDTICALLTRLEQKLDAQKSLRESYAQFEVPLGGAELETSLESFEVSAQPGEEILLELARAVGVEEPMRDMINIKNEQYPGSNPRYWAIADFNLRSSEHRFHVFDVRNRSTQSYLCAHGRGSDRNHSGFAEFFTNRVGSEASSLGVYRCAETYNSDNNGYSLKLDGLETTNSNARIRLIVIHGAWYVSDQVVAAQDKCGRSEGCPALDRRYVATVIDQLKHGSFLNICSSR
jgi:L,D-transpeptidase catalytic domain